MSKEIHERQCGSETDYEMEIGAKCEKETGSCILKDSSLSEKCGSLTDKHSSSGQPLCVVSDGNNERIITSQQNILTAKKSDGGWGWVIVFGVFFITLLIGGVNISFSLLYLEFVDLFGASRAVAGWIGSLHMFMTNIIGIFIGSMITRLGSRIVCIIGSITGLVGFALGSFATSIIQMYLAIGITAGIGSGMLLMSSLVLLQQYFNRRRALAVSIACIGFSVGGLTFGPLTVTLLQMYTIRGTLLVLAAIYFQMSAFSCLFRPAPIHNVTDNRNSANGANKKEEMVLVVSSVDSDAPSKLQQNDDEHTDAERNTIERCFPHKENNQHQRSCVMRLLSWVGQLFADVFDFSLLRSVHFQLFVFASFCLFVGMSSWLQHTPSRAAHFGVEQRLISFLPSLICVATGISRLVMGIVANMSCTSLVVQFAIAATVSGVLQATTLLATTFDTMALYCVVIGSVNGGFLSTMPTVLVELNGIEKIVKSMAIWTVAVGTGCLLATPFSGFLFDVTGNYDIPFVVCGSIQTIGGLCAACVYVMKRCHGDAKHPS